MTRTKKRYTCFELLVGAAACAGLATAVATVYRRHDVDSRAEAVPGARTSEFVKTFDGRTWLWGSGAPGDPGSEWFDFEDALLLAERLQFGIGKDVIAAIDDPVFVRPDDPRLLRATGVRRTDDILVLGLAEGDVARAYPIELLNHHELVNDEFAGRPVTVGW